MAALRSFRTDPEEEARDLEACRRDIEKLRYQRVTVEQQRMLGINVKWLERMRRAA